ncbi:hypothetical protein NDU88_003112, partial [Pleurodeles waltl]
MGSQRPTSSILMRWVTFCDPIETPCTHRDGGLLETADLHVCDCFLNKAVFF